MNAARKRAEERIIDITRRVTGDEFTPNLYMNLFKTMSDDDFDKFMMDLQEDKITMCVIVPVDTEGKISVANNVKLGKELGYDFFQHITCIGSADLPDYKIPFKSMTMLLPIRRVAQLLSKKMSVTTDHKKIDSFTGQVTGDSKSSKLTAPELHLLLGQGFNDSVIELMKTRGGDEGEGAALIAMLFNNGEAKQEDLRGHSTGVTSVKTLQSILQAMHIKANL